MLRRLFFICCFFFFFSTVILAATIRGRVWIANGRLPVVYAALLLKSTDTGVITNEKGELSFSSLAPGSYRFVVSAVGYMPLETPECLVRTKDTMI